LKLADKEYLQTLLQTGLDHLLFLLEPNNLKSWMALQAIVPEDLFVTVHITINKHNARAMDGTLERLAELGVRSLSLSVNDPALRNALEELASKAADLNLTLVFDLPVPYSEQNPVALETEEDRVPSGAGKVWLYVEPDGDVLPAQGMAEQVLGNFLKDEWKMIYHS
jgi:MoaA/NifB/PqqE/SkfB family radical SAM enzyme